MVTFGRPRPIPDSRRWGYAVKWPKLLKMDVIHSIRSEMAGLVNGNMGTFIWVSSELGPWQGMRRSKFRMHRVTTWGLPRGMTPDIPRDFIGNESSPDALSHLI